MKHAARAQWQPKRGDESVVTELNSENAAISWPGVGGAQDEGEAAGDIDECDRSALPRILIFRWN